MSKREVGEVVFVDELEEECRVVEFFGNADVKKACPVESPEDGWSEHEKPNGLYFVPTDGEGQEAAAAS